MRFPRCTLLLVALVTVLALPSSIAAEPITWLIEGSIDQPVGRGWEYLLPSVAPGDPFRVTVTFESEAVDTNPLTYKGQYQSPDGPPYGFTFWTPGYAIALPGTVTISALNRDPLPPPDTSGGSDYYAFGNGETEATRIHILFNQDTGCTICTPEDTLLQSDALLVNPPVREHWGGIDNFVTLSDDAGHVFIHGKQSSVERVPEPSVAWLFGVGLAMVAFRSRRRRRLRVR